MELQSLELLESRIALFLRQHRDLMEECEELKGSVQHLEAENAELQAKISGLRSLAADSRPNDDGARDQRIRAKVDELLAKLEGF